MPPLPTPPHYQEQAGHHDGQNRARDHRFRSLIGAYPSWRMHSPHVPGCSDSLHARLSVVWYTYIILCRIPAGSIVQKWACPHMLCFYCSLTPFNGWIIAGAGVSDGTERRSITAVPVSGIPDIVFYTPVQAAPRPNRGTFRLAADTGVSNISEGPARSCHERSEPAAAGRITGGHRAPCRTARIPPRALFLFLRILGRPHPCGPGSLSRRRDDRLPC